jgi:two-component system sensor histidine kinase/response regulator
MVKELPKILIVDDREENLMALRSTLREVEAEVIEASNGNQALTATLNHHFAVAILDVQMPGMDGYELANFMQSDSSTNIIPIIFLTANYSEEDKISRGYETGAVDYLIKPYDPFILLSKISVFLTLYSQRLELKNYSDHLEELVLERTKKLDTAIENLQNSNRELELFTKIAAHDLQEPLRRITSYSQLLGKQYREKLDKDADEIIDFIVTGAKHLQNMIIGLHDYIDVKSNCNEFKEVDLSRVLERITMQLANEINETNAVIESGNLPVIRGDNKQLGNLFFNILDNSIKFTIGYPPIVKISSSEDHEYWKFNIQDNGLGIDSEYHEKVFQIFRTLHPKDRFKGGGIGLSISKRIVERHEGKIWIESEEGKGTAIIFTIKKNL